MSRNVDTTSHVSGEPLHHFTSLIRDAYQELGYTLGWEFLYTPAATLKCPSGFVLVGINPGGDRFGETESVEVGNSYLVEQWSPDGTRLQGQVRGLFRLLAERFWSDATRGDELLNQTLTTNFCPFRSPTWRQLPRQSEAVAFSRSLWDQLLSRISPRIILSMGALPYRYLQEPLARRGGVVGIEHQLPTGWGSQKFAHRAYAQAGGNQLVLARFPHLSQYKLMSRPACEPHLRAFVRSLQQAAS